MSSDGVVLSWIKGLMDICFLFPRRADSAVAGLEEAKNPAGISPLPDSDPVFRGTSFEKTSSILQDKSLEAQIPDSTLTRAITFSPCAQQTVLVG